MHLSSKYNVSTLAYVPNILSLNRTWGQLHGNVIDYITIILTKYTFT